MTKLILQTDNTWTKKKIRTVIQTEAALLRKIVQKSQQKLQDFEQKYGTFDRETLYGKIDDMELVEWEGELETLERFMRRLQSLEEITFEYN